MADSNSLQSFNAAVLTKTIKENYKASYDPISADGPMSEQCHWSNLVPMI